MFLWRLRRYTSCSRDANVALCRVQMVACCIFFFFTFQSHWFTSSHTFPVSLANKSNFTAGCVWGFGHGWLRVGPRLYYPSLHMQTVTIPIKYGLGCVFRGYWPFQWRVVMEQFPIGEWAQCPAKQVVRPCTSCEIGWPPTFYHQLLQPTPTFMHRILCHVIKLHEI